MIDLIIGITIFIIGLLMGSFYNVVAYRLSNNLSITKPKRSFCPSCKKTLSAKELIPVFSYLYQGGRCRNCNSKISIYYPLVELLTGIFFLMGYLLYGFKREFFLFITLSSYLIIILESDFRYYIIPDQVTIAASIITLLIKLTISFKTFILALLNGLVVFLIVYLFTLIMNKLFNKETLGGGDIKLMFYMGTLFSFINSFFTFFIASFIALPFAIYLLIRKKESKIAFGPFIVIGALIIFIFKLDFIEFLNSLILVS